MFLLRLLLLGLLRLLYRVRVTGREHLPVAGGALLVANHVSFVDALLISAASPRSVRFLMHRSFFAVPVVGWFARCMRTIPVATEDSPREKVRALAAAATAARNGELVCIFAEGAITRTGILQGFRRGLEKIARQAEVAIVPVALDRVWGSVFSFERGRAFWKIPRRVPYPIDIAFGAPLPSNAPAWRVRIAVSEALADLRREREGRGETLAIRFLRAARAHADEQALVELDGRVLTYRQLLAAALALRSSLRERLGDAPCVGVLLPPGAAGAIANLAVSLTGGVSVNLNATLSNATLASSLERAGAKVVLTSSRVLAALGRSSPLARESTLDVEELLSECRG
jgi:acyl-[acyl-carrier-protein]-phospholipid O-acyltransferase/long-chain-fatty-acid--[acyl-carrier-protein] ligase